MNNFKVIKRDERIQPYDWTKVEAAVSAAFKSVNQEMDDTFKNYLKKSVESAFKNVDAISVEDIQDIIQRELIKRNKYDAAEAFIVYRNKRTEIRERNSELVKEIAKKLNGTNIENQNANVDESSFGGRIGEAARVVTKNDALKYRMSKKSRKNHDNNEIYIHDLDSYSSGMHNCLSIPFDDLLANGFKTRQTDVRPAGSVNTAMQLVAVIMQLQSLQQFGGVAATHLDWTMVPYVRKSFFKHFKDGMKYIDNDTDEDIQDFVDMLTGMPVKSWLVRNSDGELENHGMREPWLEDNIWIQGKNYNRSETYLGVIMANEEINAKYSYVQDKPVCVNNIAYDYKTKTYYLAKPIDIKDISIDDMYYKNHHAVYQYAIDMTEKEIYQAVEGLYHNLNTLQSRSGNQLPFSSINYGTDTSAEGRCVIREILNTTYRGVGNNSTAIFPIQIWKKKRGVSYLPEDKNYDLYQLACKVSARRFFPNFVNLDATFNQHELWDINDPKRYKYEVATMGCRTRVFDNRFGEKTSIGRGNLSFTTMNIVKIGIESAIESRLILKINKKYVNNHLSDWNEEEYKNAKLKAKTLFFEKLDRAMNIAVKQLNERFNFQKTALKKQFPLLMSGMWNGSDKLKENDTIESVINQGTLGIGFIGLAETLIALTGKHHGESESSQKLGLEIISHMRKRINEFSEKYQHNYSVLATPAEGLSGKFTKVDKEKYGEIEGITDKEYYTNSNHVPVYYKCTPKHKAEVEGPYHELTGGGHIFYVEMDGDATHNPEAIMKIVDLMDKYNIGYCSVNHNRSRCLDCGYENADKEMKTCPKCGSENIDTLQRITG